MNYVLYIVCIRVNIPLFKDTEVEYQRELRTNSQFIYIFVNSTNDKDEWIEI